MTEKNDPAGKPTERTESEVDEASMGSFPASDPPPWTPPGSALPDVKEGADEEERQGEKE